MKIFNTSDSYIQWFDRCVGNWVSYRRYLYFNPKSDREPFSQNIRTEFVTGKNADRSYFVSWESVDVVDHSPTSSGTMNFLLEGNVFSGYRIIRDRAYFEETETVTRLHYIDIDALSFHSAYGGNTYREEIRFLPGDNVRLRQTVSTPTNGDSLGLSGQYTELRV